MDVRMLRVMALMVDNSWGPDSFPSVTVGRGQLFTCGERVAFRETRGVRSRSTSWLLAAPERLAERICEP
jgi:hypothetical protein